jgi:FtsP/CotA-like multicopper oxidase with cupredoxin domain
MRRSRVLLVSVTYAFEHPQVEGVIMIRFEFGKHEGRTRFGRVLSRSLLLMDVCLVAMCCSASAGTLPNILTNDNRVPAGRLNSGVLTLHLELREGLWHPEAEDGRAIDVYSFAEQGRDPVTPGPLIRVPQGTELHVSVHNILRVPAAVHGLHQHPGKADDYIQLAPDETKEARFTAGEPGSYFYWASALGSKTARRRTPTSEGSLEARPVDESMMSAGFIVDKAGLSTNDRIFVIQVWAKDIFTPNFAGVLSINGKSWPYTERLHARLSQPEHWRIVNATPFEHPMPYAPGGPGFFLEGVSEKVEPVVRRW